MGQAGAKFERLDQVADRLLVAEQRDHAVERRRLAETGAADLAFVAAMRQTATGAGGPQPRQGAAAG